MKRTALALMLLGVFGVTHAVAAPFADEKAPKSEKKSGKKGKKGGEKKPKM